MSYKLKHKIVPLPNTYLCSVLMLLSYDLKFVLIIFTGIIGRYIQSYQLTLFYLNNLYLYTILHNT